MKRRYFLPAMALGVILCFNPVLAYGDFYVIGGGAAVGTKITSLPYTIANPGFYYLGGDLSYNAGVAITVNANHVTIDLMGFCLSGNGTSSGIYMNGRKNVEIRNGTIRNFAFGINEESATAVRHRIINIRVEGNNTYGLNSYGIRLNGEAHLARGCTAWGSNTGIGFLSTGTVIGCQVEGCRFGIDVHTSGNVIGNFVTSGETQVGIVGGDLMLDQNTAIGAGIHYDIFGAGAVWGTNVGKP